MIDSASGADTTAPSSNGKSLAGKKVISGPGLTPPGVVLLQFLLILLVETFEYNLTKIGLLTGIAILAAVAGGIYLGRRGSEFATAVNPPLAFLLATFINLVAFSGDGLHIARFGLAFISSLANVAPFLIIGAIASWGFYFTQNKKSA